MLSERGSDSAVEEAGFKELHKAFGFYSTLHELSGGCLIKENKLLSLSVAEVYLKIQYRSHEAGCIERYQEIKKRNATRNNRVR